MPQVRYSPEMTPQKFQDILQQTLDDHLLSRAERKALKLVLEEIQPAETQLDLYRHVAFDLARQTLATALDKDRVIDWLEDVVRLLKPAVEDGQSVKAEAHFSPGNRCRSRIRTLLQQARNTVDICVFTITDDEISAAVAEAHHRGVDIRIISDDDKANDTGSDIDRLAGIGVQVRLDRSRFHMHHKFAIFDESNLLCGSYNWTRSAAESNEENIIVLNDPHLLKVFGKEFDELWARYGDD